ncbi:MAG: TlpA disulfide reductase family protein [Bryobacteraceae bacterium]|nr:TlpA disulfide reductase family protein [Bryobacteraceae bacterium]
MKRLAIALLLLSVAMQAQITRRAPGFSLPDVTYKQYDLADYRGKVVLIDIIQTGCPKCIELTRSLTEVKQKYGDKVQVLTIVTLPDSPQTINAYTQRYGVRNPVLLDCGQVIGSYLGLTPQNPSVHFPHLFVIDKLGNIRRDLDETQVTMTNIVGAIESALK